MDIPQQCSVRLSVAKIKSGLICYMTSSTYPFKGRGDFGNSKRRRIEEVHVAVKRAIFTVGRRHNYLNVLSKTVLLNEHASSVLYATLEFLCSLLSAIYAASSFCYHVRYYKTGLNGVVHFAELVNVLFKSKQCLTVCQFVCGLAYLMGLL